MSDTKSNSSPKFGMFQNTDTSRKKMKMTCPVKGKAAEYIANLYPSLKIVQEEEPIFYSPEVDAWVVSKYEDVQTVFKGVA